MEWEYFPSNVDEEKPLKKASCLSSCIAFKSFANILHLNEVESDKLKEAVKSFLADWYLGYVEMPPKVPYGTPDMNIFLEKILTSISVDVDYEKQYNISNDKLETAGMIMYYLLSAKNIASSKFTEGDWQSMLVLYDDVIEYQII